MPRYLIETYLRRDDPAERLAGEARARSIAAQMTLVRFECSIHMLEDEICFYLFDAPSAGVATDAARRAGLDPIRVVEAVASGVAPPRAKEEAWERDSRC